MRLPRRRVQPHGPRPLPPTPLLDGQEQFLDRWFLPKSFPVRAYDAERYHVNYERWWDLPDLPKLNFDNEACEHIRDVAEWWSRSSTLTGGITTPSRSRTNWKEYAAGSAR